MTSARLLPGVFADAQRADTEALLRLDVDRLLVPYRREAGIPLAGVESYGGWEVSGLGGHAAGHVVAALAHTITGTGDARAIDMLTRLRAGLSDAQRALGTGYLGGVPGGVELWRELDRGEVTATPFELNGRWVPLYNLHKTLHGLVTAGEEGMLGEERTLLDGYGQWWLETLERIDDATLARILVTEFGGMTDAFARLALLTGDRRYLDLAVRFAPPRLLDPLADGRDDLDGVHANTQIPVVTGFATIARAARALGAESVDAERFERAASFFLRTVATGRSTVIGGNSVREHFPPHGDADAFFVAREGPETCNTINMIALADELYALTADDALLEWIENATINHLLSTQHPGHGGIVYFTSHRPEHYRVSSPEADGFWCCMLSGFEAHAQHHRRVVREGAGRVEIDRWVPSVVASSGAGLVIEQRSDYPHADSATTVVRAERPVVVTVSLRVPRWAEDAAVVIGDGAPRGVAAGERLVWEREWSGETAIELTWTRRVRIEPSAAGEGWGTVVRGGVALAARHPDPDVAYRADGGRTSHIAGGPLAPLARTPVLDAATVVVPAGNEDAVVSTVGARIVLEPLHRIHDARYTLCWPVAGTDPEARREQLRRRDRQALSLDARTVDAISFGEQQPERDHRLSAPDSEVGVAAGVRWRRPGGELSFVLGDWGGTATTLRVEWLRDPHASSSLDVRVDGAGAGSVPVVFDPAGAGVGLGVGGGVGAGAGAGVGGGAGVGAGDAGAGAGVGVGDAGDAGRDGVDAAGEQLRVVDIPLAPAAANGDGMRRIALRPSGDGPSPRLTRVLLLTDAADR